MPLASATSVQNRQPDALNAVSSATQCAGSSKYHRYMKSSQLIIPRINQTLVLVPSHEIIRPTHQA